MNTTRRLMLVLGLIATSLILSQCKLPERRSDDYFASVVPPLQGAVFGVGENVEIHGGVVDSLEDINTTRINHLYYYANGIQIGEEYQTIMPGYYLTTERNPPIWIPEEPGEYYLQVSSFRRPHWAISQAVRVCVIDFSLSSPELGDLGSYYGTYGFEDECELPERSPDAVPGPITFDVTASPDPLIYFPGWWFESYYGMVSSGELPIPDGCEDIPSEITFRAAVGDPNDDVVMVKVDIFYEWIASIDRYLSLLLTREGGAGLDPKIFSGEAWTQNYGNPSEINKSFEVDWTAYAYDRAGDIVATDGPHTIPVNPCYNAETARDITIPSEPPEFTLPDVTCPEGTFYIPILRRCVATTSFDTDGFRGIDLNGPDEGEESDQGENSCNLSSEICGDQGYSFDSNNCQCIPLP